MDFIFNLSKFLIDSWPALIVIPFKKIIKRSRVLQVHITKINVLFVSVMGGCFFLDRSDLIVYIQVE